LATLNLLVVARDWGNIKKFVYSSSSSIYGDSPNLPSKESDAVNPISPYSLSKFAGERYCQIFSKIYSLPTVCLRYFNVFGPKQNPISQYGAVIPRFVFSMLQNKKPVIYGDGEQTRDFTYVDNVVEANILAAFSEVSGEVINIACNQRISVNEIAKLINGFLGTDIRPSHGLLRPGEIRHSLADISKAEKLLKYQPKVYFKEGLQKTVEWFRMSGILEIAERFASIRFANDRDIGKIAQIYQQKIKTGFVSSLGLPFLARLYETIIKSKYGTCLVVELDNKVVGFIAGAFNTNKLYWDFSRRNFFKVGPMLALKVLNPKKIKKVFETLFYPKKRKELSGAELFVVELEEDLEEGELRDLLFKNFVSEIKKRNIKSFKTVVHESFKDTIDFYKRMGLKFYEPIEIHKGERSEIYLYVQNKTN
jgi:dTDP-4-dehydrorhamnose reductase